MEEKKRLKRFVVGKKFKIEASEDEREAILDCSECHKEFHIFSYINGVTVQCPHCGFKEFVQTSSGRSKGEPQWKDKL